MDSAGNALNVTVTTQGEVSEYCSTCLPNQQAAAIAMRSAAEPAGNRVFSTAQPTPPNGATSPQPFVFVYTATDAQGRAASLNRTVTVLDPCNLPEGWCTNLGECNPASWVMCKMCPTRISLYTCRCLLQVWRLCAKHLLGVQHGANLDPGHQHPGADSPSQSEQHVCRMQLRRPAIPCCTLRARRRCNRHTGWQLDRQHPGMPTLQLLAHLLHR